MAKRTVHPYNIAAAEALAKDPPTFPPEPTTSDADAMEAKAREQYAEACRGYFPGFAFSDLPANFVVGLARTEEGCVMAVENGKDPNEVPIIRRSAWPLCREVSQWGKLREHLLDYPDPYAVPIIPEGWSYAATVGNAKPHHFDLKNPRLYTLEGRMVPWDAPNPKVWTWTYMQPKGHFATILLEVFTQAAPNDQAAEVVAFLEHHRTRGGNPEALADYVEELLERWKVDPHLRLNLNTWKEEPLPRHRILSRAIERWLADARKAPALVKDATSENSEAPTFAALLGERLPDVLKAMKDAGIQAVTGKGIGKVVAVLHAACEHYGKSVPAAHHWPAMIEQLFPDVKCSPKVKPLLSKRERERESRGAYAQAYWAIMDRLK
jgi:hypothetical protein